MDEYLERLAEPARAAVKQMRSTIRAVMPPDATETISYRIPAFRRRRVLVWYAGFKNHCSLFPTAEVIQQFNNELKGYTVSKGTIQFPLDKPLPAALIRKIVKARIERA